MKGRVNDDAIAGAFEELPALLVVLVAVSLFSVSVAHAVSTRGEAEDYAGLLDDCLAFSGMVRCSDTLCIADCPGTYDISRLQNISEEDLLEEFNSTLMGFEYRVVINCIDPETGNITLRAEVGTSAIPQDVEFTSAHTCVNVSDGGRMYGARVTVTVWRAET